MRPARTSLASDGLADIDGSKPSARPRSATATPWSYVTVRARSTIVRESDVTGRPSRTTRSTSRSRDPWTRRVDRSTPPPCRSRVTCTVSSIAGKSGRPWITAAEPWLSTARGWSCGSVAAISCMCDVAEFGVDVTRTDRRVNVCAPSEPAQLAPAHHSDHFVRAEALAPELTGKDDLLVHLPSRPDVERSWPTPSTSYPPTVDNFHLATLQPRVIGNTNQVRLCSGLSVLLGL